MALERLVSIRKFTVLAGAGGCGKTNLAIALAAIITSGGVFPDGTHSEEKVRLLFCQWKMIQMTLYNQG